FFFSSRRRHTSISRDWSSDVCSSDLQRGKGAPGTPASGLPLSPQTCRSDREGQYQRHSLSWWNRSMTDLKLLALDSEDLDVISRSEERRVGKESRSGERQ